MTAPAITAADTAAWSDVSSESTRASTTTPRPFAASASSTSTAAPLPDVLSTFVVPVLPAIGTGRLTVLRAVPRWTTPRIMDVSWYAVTSFITRSRSDTMLGASPLGRLASKQSVQLRWSWR